ncbi:hypothetical protein NEOLEDRAFT_137924 [Neolentinus lepideus HHB14362 ss-1]|uniref:Uncharacterized protein n=1 Tax=Neolentinus lepideus HHB14362 ss-1 TaxID=1314782 RepID=A0A165TZ42_9AGAM|nr:hypothetical protein NEOLEDRAFT_137924 [Neolentinus lepideus HHB14362 ss-1]
MTRLIGCRSHPGYVLDILQLSRTNKSLRSMLMRRGSAFIWRAALATAVAKGLPPCVSDLNEPQYIRLMFEWSCTFCGGPTFHWGQWALRVRCCEACARDRLVDHWNASRMLPQGFKQKQLVLGSSIMTNFEVKERREQCYEDDDEEEDREEEVRSYGTWYLKSDVIAVAEKFEEALTEETKFHGFLRDRTFHVAVVNRHAERMRKWQLENSFAREEDAILDWRKKAIIHNLKELGYSSSLERWSEEEMIQFSKHPAVKDPQSLTMEEWTSIKDTIIEYVKGIKNCHLKYEWKNETLAGRLTTLGKVLKEYCLAQEDADPVPPVIDFCYMKAILEIVEAPQDVKVTKESFSGVIPLLPAMAESWHKDVLNKLFKVLPATLANQDQSSLDILFLATTQFSCAWDNAKAPLTSDRLFIHHCLTKWEKDGVSPDRARLLPGASPEIICSRLQAVPWGMQHYSQLAFHPEASEYARYIVEACEKDLKTTTALEMDNLDARLECTKCKGLIGLQ